MFKRVENQNFIEIEKKWLKKFYEEGIVDKYLHKNDDSKETFSFIDGPITANNPMGLHHAWGRTYKDLWQRYNNMKGKKQRFQNGFDNQGLWVEVEVEKDKNFKTKKDIEEYGIGKFVQDCKNWTLKWAGVQTEQSKKLGYFMDWDNSYYTLSDENNYMIWTFLYKCFEEGWLYKGKDSIPWCPRCGTAISQHEILTEDYLEIEDDAVYLRFPIKGKKNEYLLVWTTTPWTIAGNVAVAVNPKVEYKKVRQGDDIYYISTARLGELTDKYDILETVKGSDLVGIEYENPFIELESVSKEKPQYVTIEWDEIGEDEGTGMVHIAPGCGQEDFMLGKANKLSIVIPLDDDGNFIEGFGFLSGKYAHDVSGDVFDYLKKKDIFYKSEKYMHRYPKCWRCKTKLLFRCVDEWYISMDDLRQNMMDVTKKIRWIPEFGMKRELDWLKNMEDWLISKKRYWGLALPIWECNKCGGFTVIKDEKMLEEKAVEGYEKFKGHSPHRPYIDEVKIKCEKCGEICSRIKDVGNPWLDAGIAPYSTLKYRTDKKYWEKWFPADFVTECFPGQFKNWFYSLIAESTALENKPPFKNLLGHGLVKDVKGENMHKSSGNAIWFDDAVEKIGADLLRWTFMRHNPENDLWFGYKLTDDVKKNFLLIYWNTYKYLVMYADLNKFDPSNLDISNLDLSLMDKWVLSRYFTTLRYVEDKMNNFDAMSSVLSLEKLIQDISTWYIRRNREKFAGGDITALSVLYYVFFNVNKVMMMYMPFLTEEIHQNLKTDSDPEYVQLADYPEVMEKYINEDHEKNMEMVRVLSSMGQSVRIDAGIKLRQPLSECIIKGAPKLSDDYLDILKEEMNVKKVKVSSKDVVGKDIKEVINSDLYLFLNTKITKELELEGLLREVSRTIQNERKNVGLNVGDSVEVVIVSDKLQEASKGQLDELKASVYAKSVVVTDKPAEESTKERIFVTI
ncbi:MAG: isoleucine--tRNA ligase [bacterium]